MSKKLLAIASLASSLLLSFLFPLFSSSAKAIVDPLAVPNNRFGIHILEPEDIVPAGKLVNSSGGDWGYVTLIIRANDLNLVKWQAIFDQLRRVHLIPIIRLASYPENDGWQIPQPEKIGEWVEFLNSLNWVTTNRYIILFNEPNHVKEWGNKISPDGYASIVVQFHDQLKQASPDFFILPAALDTAAPNSSQTMAAPEYWRQMYQSNQEIFSYFDGWNSHSYPNPNFSGPANGVGFGTVSGFLSEINYLKNFGLPAKLPIFITETGWAIKSSQDQLYKSAFSHVWQNSQIAAITPFILNYQQPPFDQFSWQIPETKDFLSHYYSVQNLPKITGLPIIEHNSQIIKSSLPDQLIDNSDYNFNLIFKNSGQSIWTRDQFALKITSNLDPKSISAEYLSDTEPQQSAQVNFHLHTPDNLSKITLFSQLEFRGQPFGESISSLLTVIPPPRLIIKAKPLFKIQQKNLVSKLLIYNRDNQIIYQFNLGLDNSTSQSLRLYNLIPGETYRLVLLKDYYLPRQKIINLSTDELTVNFPDLLPFDLDKSGYLSLADLWTAIIHPILTFKLYCSFCRV